MVGSTESCGRLAFAGGLAWGAIMATALMAGFLLLQRQFFCNKDKIVTRSSSKAAMNGYILNSSLGGVSHAISAMPLPGNWDPLQDWKLPPGFAGVQETEGSNDSSSMGANTVSGRSLSPCSSVEDWHIEPSRISICQDAHGTNCKLGSGSFGSVYKAVLDHDQVVAIKFLSPMMKGSAHANAHFSNEVDIMRQSCHNNIVHFVGACFKAGVAFMVQELMPHGDLYSLLQDPLRKAQYMWYNRGRDIALQVASGLAALHAHGIIHFDIKSANILLDGTTAKIADVGLAHALMSKSHLSVAFMRGTWSYVAPEALTGQRCDEHVDLWSLGIVMWELVTGEAPQRGRNRTLRVPEECPSEIEELIERCNEVVPANRPTAEEVIRTIQASPKQRPSPAYPSLGARSASW